METSSKDMMMSAKNRKSATAAVVCGAYRGTFRRPGWTWVPKWGSFPRYPQTVEAREDIRVEQALLSCYP